MKPAAYIARESNSHSWPRVKLGDVLKKSDKWLRLNPNETYQELSVRLWGRGIVLRREISGAGIASTTRLRVHAGQFILSRIDARNDAFGIIPKQLEGAVVSNDFPVFDTDLNRLSPDYLGWLSRTQIFVDACRLASEGTTNRVRLKENKFYQIEIPLPPLAEQRRIVEKIERLAAKIEVAQGLRRQGDDQVDALLVTMAHRMDIDPDTKRKAGWRQVAIGDVIHEVKDTHVVKPDTDYPNLGIYSFGRGLFKKPPIQGLSTSAKTLYRVRAGQFIYSRLFAFEGAYGLVSDGFNGCFVSNEYPTFECNNDLVMAEFLYAYFKSSDVWRKISAGSKGLGDRRQRVKPEEILAFRLMLPPLDWQNRIRNVMAQAGVLRRFQTQAATELDALLPSILDKAFKGEL